MASFTLSRATRIVADTQAAPVARAAGMLRRDMDRALTGAADENEIALLRLGGNLVIPGTGQNAHRYRELAASYGLYITHHHAEPRGARSLRTA